jgi:hypothetical protein
MFILLGLFFIVRGDCELPVMSIGHFNISSERQLKDILKKEPIFLLGITSSSCENCCKSEILYKSLLEVLDSYRPKIPFLRIDITAHPFIKKYAIEQVNVPEIFGIRKGNFFKYYDMQDALKIVRFVDKLISPVTYMNNLEEIHEFLKPPTGGFNSLNIIAFLYDSDLRIEFEKAVAPLSNWFAMDVRAVIDKEIIKKVKETREEVNYLNSLLL